MSDETTAIRAGGTARLPELQANNAELRAALESILSPAVIAALASTPGAASPAFPATGEQSAEASALLRELDSMLPPLSLAATTGGAR